MDLYTLNSDLTGTKKKVDGRVNSNKDQNNSVHIPANSYMIDMTDPVSHPLHNHTQHIQTDPTNPKEKPKRVMFGPYIVGPTIGKGEFGKVKMGWTSVPSGSNAVPKQVAIKFIRRDSIVRGSDREVKMFREINALKHLTHPNIVRLQDVLQNSKYIGIVLVYVAGGEFYKYIQKRRRLREPEACRIFAQLISGVGYMHGKGLVHRDLKLENLLLDNNLNLVITDFGFVNEFNRSSSLMKTSCGSPCYAAPELVISTEGYVGTKADIWSCGIILFAMLAGYLPWDDDPDNPGGEDIGKLYNYILSTPLKFPEYVTLRPRDLLRKILVPDPERRLDMQGIKSHQWLSPHANFLSITVEQWDTTVRQRRSYRRPQIYSYHPSTDTTLPTHGKITDAGRRLVNTTKVLNEPENKTTDFETSGLISKKCVGASHRMKTDDSRRSLDGEIGTFTPVRLKEKGTSGLHPGVKVSSPHHQSSERDMRYEYQRYLENDMGSTAINTSIQTKLDDELSDSTPSPPLRPLTVRNVVDDDETVTSPRIERHNRQAKIRPTSFHASMRTTTPDDINLQTELLSGLTLDQSIDGNNEVLALLETQDKHSKRMSMPIHAVNSGSFSSRTKQTSDHQLGTIGENCLENSSDSEVADEEQYGNRTATTPARGQPRGYLTVSGSSKYPVSSESADRKKRFSTPTFFPGNSGNSSPSNAFNFDVKRQSSSSPTGSGTVANTLGTSRTSTIPRSITLANTSVSHHRRKQDTTNSHGTHSRSRSVNLKKATGANNSSPAEVAAVKASTRARENMAHAEPKTVFRRSNSTARRLLGFFKHGSTEL